MSHAPYTVHFSDGRTVALPPSGSTVTVCGRPARFLTHTLGPDPLLVLSVVELDRSHILAELPESQAHDFGPDRLAVPAHLVSWPGLQRDDLGSNPEFCLTGRRRRGSLRRESFR